MSGPHIAGRPISSSTYSNYGCRCDGCRDDANQSRRLLGRGRRGGSTPIRLRLIPRTELLWKKQAACIGEDMDVFFPMRGESRIPAKLICGRCEVRQECLEYAITHEEWNGVWGGKSELERRRFANAAARRSGL